MRFVQNTDKGYKLGNFKITNLTYADDMAFLSKSVGWIQTLLRTAEVGLAFNEQKAHLCTLKVVELMRSYQRSLPSMDSVLLQSGDPYQHLGIPPGYDVGKNSCVIHWECQAAFC